MTTAREILEELVACKDLHERIESMWASGFSFSDESTELMIDYKRRKPLAWRAAREFLAQSESQPETMSMMASSRDAEHWRKAAEAYRSAYTPDGHNSPGDCFATGPFTDDPVVDLLRCPGCVAEAVYNAAIAKESR